MYSPQNDRAVAFDAASPRRRRRNGFTLAEILIVVGIIAVLAALVLTVRSKASDQARSVQCLSNLRQIGMAMTLYAQGNNQAFPYSGFAGTTPDPTKDRPSDWIAFRAPDVDRAATPTGVGGLSSHIDKSAIAPYAKVKGPAFVNMMRCPTDELSIHPTDPRATFQYRLSYSMNVYMSSDAPSPPAVGIGRGMARNRGVTPRVTAITRPAEKILVVDQAAGTLNDGEWDPGQYQNFNTRTSGWNVSRELLSIRHDARKPDIVGPADIAGDSMYDADKRGNVLFVDGHAEGVSRIYAHSAKNVLVTDEGTGVATLKYP